MIQRFRPLIGVSFCKLASNLEVFVDDISVSVPLSGLVSVNGKSVKSVFPYLSGRNSFRPLIGVSFCKLNK